MGNAVKGNPLLTRKDVERAAMQLIEPLLPHLSEGYACLKLGDTGATYTDRIAQMEAYSRIWWAIIPMVKGGSTCVKPIFDMWKRGLINGTDPNHPEYWGEVSDYDQRLVEMAVMGMALLMIPEEFFFSLPKENQANVYNWLNQINNHEMPPNNWTFFRVLINVGFMNCDLPYSKNQLEKDLALIESHYEGDGWYFDYENQREYYTMWAFHYYGMIYGKYMKERDPDRSAKYLERARLMSDDFAMWFDNSGEALPYGRSLTYRFAQSSFYAMAAFCDVYGKKTDMGTSKHLLLSNLRKWFKSPIFTRDGVLTIGYHYPNLIMGEGYNAPGSPYWAMKSFACLALPEEHPFWQVEEKVYLGNETMLQPHARMLMVRSKDQSHVMGFEAGNHASEHSHDEAKYEKFVYSTVFGFSVPKSSKLLKAGAYDNMLALSEDGSTYHPRYGCESYELKNDRVISIWKPFMDVTVKSEIIPFGEWHVRVHHINTTRELYVAEGGYAISRDGNGELETSESQAEAVAYSPWGVSGIKALKGYDEACLVIPEPNTNLMAPRTMIPTLKAKIKTGDSILVSLVLGTQTGGMALWQKEPEEAREYAEMG